MQMSQQVSYIIYQNLPLLRDLEPEWVEEKLNQTHRNIQSFRGT